MPSFTPCLLSSVEFGTDVAASAANHHFPGEAAAVASSFGAVRHKLGIWDIERGEVDFYLRAFDDEGRASTWADAIWGHHPRSIFCFSPRRMKMVDLRSAAVSTAIDIGTAGFLPSGRFYGAHSPCDARVPMIFTSCSSAVSSWDLRFLREPVAQCLHHLEHDPPSLIASSIRDCTLGSDGHQKSSRLSMDILTCSSFFGYPLLHSIKIGDEHTPVTFGLPHSIYGLRHAHELQHSSRALHPDGAQSSAAVTVGMCLLSNSLPRGIQTVAFFSSLSGDIWLSYASDECSKAERGNVAGSASFHLESQVSHGAASTLQSVDHEFEPNLRNNFADDARELILPASSEFQKWMAFPRMLPPFFVPFFPFTFTTGTVDEIAVFLGSVIKCKGLVAPSILFQLLPSCCLWRLGSSGIWHMITESNLLPTSFNTFDILCATGGSPPADYLPSICTKLQVPPASLASAVDIAFAHHTVAALPLPEPAKSQPTLSALKLFGSPVRFSQSQPSQPQVRFKGAKAHTDLSSPRNQSDHRTTHVFSNASAIVVSTAPTKGFLSATSPSAPHLDDISNPLQNTSTSWSTLRGTSSAARGLKRRSSEGF